MVLNIASGKDTSTEPVELTEYNGTLKASEATTITVNSEGKLGSDAKIDAAKATTIKLTNGATASNVVLATPELVNLTVESGADLTLGANTDLFKVENTIITMDDGKSFEWLSKLLKLLIGKIGLSKLLPFNQGPGRINLPERLSNFGEF